MRSSYKADDVTLLLKDITGLVNPQPTEEREKLIQTGRHYSEMLPIEYVPTEKYMEAYQDALEKYAGATAQAVFHKKSCKRGAKTWCSSRLRGREFPSGFW